MIHMLMPFLLLTAQPIAEEEPASELNCADPQAQQELNACAAEEFERADAELIYQWKDTAALMVQYDAEAVELDYTVDDRPGHFDTLIEAQTAWLTFREAHCRSAGYAVRGGSLEPLIVSTCMTTLTLQRILQLRDLMPEELAEEAPESE